MAVGQRTLAGIRITCGRGRKNLPRYVLDATEDYLRCGLLEHGVPRRVLSRCVANTDAGPCFTPFGSGGYEVHAWDASGDGGGVEWSLTEWITMANEAHKGVGKNWAKKAQKADPVGVPVLVFWSPMPLAITVSALRIGRKTLGPF